MKVLVNTLRRALVVAVACAITLAVVGVDATAQTTLPGRTVIEQRIISFLSELNLSEAQKVQIEGILRAERPAVETLVRQLGLGDAQSGSLKLPDRLPDLPKAPKGPEEIEHAFASLIRS